MISEISSDWESERTALRQYIKYLLEKEQEKWRINRISRSTKDFHIPVVGRIQVYHEILSLLDQSNLSKKLLMAVIERKIALCIREGSYTENKIHFYENIRQMVMKS